MPPDSVQELPVQWVTYSAKLSAPSCIAPKMVGPVPPTQPDGFPSPTDSDKHTLGNGVGKVIKSAPVTLAPAPHWIMNPLGKIMYPSSAADIRKSDRVVAMAPLPV